MNENLYGNNGTFHPIPVSWKKNKERESRSGFLSVLAHSFDSALEAPTATPDGGLFDESCYEVNVPKRCSEAPNMVTVVSRMVK